MDNRTKVGGLLLVIIAASGCGGVDEEHLFSISSAEVLLKGGAPGLQFAALPSEDVRITKAIVSFPTGDEIKINGYEDLFLAGSALALQPSDSAYPKLSGSWSFRFIGHVVAGNDQFDATATLEVAP